MAQDGSNKRGFSPGNAFFIGDIETINTTNGNLMLRFPLTALPSGRNGLSAGLNLYYNSKLYDTETQWFADPNGNCNMVGYEGEAIMVCPYYQKSVLKESSQGGWQFGAMYTLTLLDRHDQFNNVPQELKPNCWNPNWQAYSPGAQEMRYHYKLMLNFPDGSSHEMRPNGWSDGNFNDPLGDWFDIRPDGYWHDCINTQWYTGTMTYYSIDGSFLRLDIAHDSDTDPMNNPWTLYFPDGSKVTSNQPNSEPQRFYDRNNNYLELLGSEVRDHFNRSIGLSISWENGLPVWTVTSQGFGQTLSWTIHWKWISVLKNYWPCADSLNCPPDVQQQEPYGMPRLVIDRMTLPTQAGGLTYQFQYNAPNHVPGQPLSASVGWGEISGITLPSGAQVNYQWLQDGTHPASATPDILRNAPTGKVLSYNQEYDGAVTPAPDEIWTYDITPSGGSTVTAPDGGVTTTVFVDPSTPIWNAGLTLWTIGPDGTKTETIWDRNNLASSGNANPYPKTVFTSIKSGSTYVKTAVKDYKYDKNGNVTRVAEYDWVNYDDVPRDSFGTATGLPAVSPTRVTVNTFFNSTPDATQLAGSNTNVYWSSGSPRVKNAIASTEIRKVLSGGSELAVARGEYTYDNPSVPANVTDVRSWDSTKGAYSNPLTTGNSLSATTQYNQYGMPTLITDARGLKTHVTYGPIGTATDLYPTQIKTAYQTAQERTETREYHLATGLVTRVTDVDNNVSTATSFDVLGRPTLVTAAEGKAEETKTAYEYSDLLRRVITRSDLTTSGDGKLVSIQHYDQLGRTRLSRQLEDASSQLATDETTGIKVQTRYRFSGANSFVLVSNAYRAGTSSAASGEPTMGWTRSKSDDAGRVIEVQTFGGSGLPAPWGSNTTTTGTVTTAYDANFTTVSDQAQKQRRSVINGLGHLIRVDEPNASGILGDAASPNQPTHYTYDVLGNLTKVTQSDGGTTQQRDFVYSSLSRLTQATNPESGTIDYKYDESGNLVVRTDARGVSTHYSYDALNRITRRWYNASSSVSATSHEPSLPEETASTAEVKFYYDAQSLPIGAPTYDRGVAKGRLVAQTYGIGTNGDYFAYDNLGRATLKYQQTGTVNYLIEASYNRASAITLLKYPSDRTVNHTYDAAGRLNILNGNLGGVSRTYSTGIIYSPSGGMTKEQFGTNPAIYNKLFYNSRGQLAEIRTSTSYTGPIDYSADRGAIVNNYSANCTGICSGSSIPDNNGNLRKQEIHIPSQTMRWQEYLYDSLNRLDQAREVLNGGAEQWKQKFIYDRWGNRRIDNANTYGIGINNKAFDVIPANNRLAVPSGQSGVMQYDDAGNLTHDTYTGAGNRTYDAENKITSAWGGNNQAQLYGYDASGQRIKRTVDGIETWQVYGFGGELLAEYPVNGAAASPQKEYGYRNGQLLITAELPRTNLALAANGATASSASQVSGNYPASSTINGDRRGLNWNNGGGWNDGTVNTHPDWLQIDFNGSKTVDEISVFTLQDNPATPAEPTESMTFTLYGLTGYSVQYWNGSAWTTVPGGSVTGNNKVWRKFTFAPITTTKIRVLTSSSPDAYSRITEVEAWGYQAPPSRTNFALGGLTSASSTINANYPAVSTINGDRRGLNWNSGGGWNDAAPANTFSDWLQVDFSGSKTIDEISVFTLQDNPATPAEPTESMTFSLYGLTSYNVQYWNGSAWTTVPGGTVTGNNKVWKKITFSPITTSKIRVVTNASVDGYSRLTEVEAWGQTETGATSGIRWLVADHLGTPRMIFDQTGELANMTRHDYLPFGEELFAPTGGRTVTMGYASGDGVRQQFTLYERDQETGLDFAQARYFSSTQGRFISVDPLTASATAGKPQSWNRYSYSFNSPLRFVDPSGLAPDDYYASRDGTITIYETPGNTDVFYVESNTTPGTFNYVAQVQRNAAGLVEFPANGTGFARYGTIDLGGMDRATNENVGAGDHYLQPIAAAALFGLTSVLNTDHNLTVSLGDMSSDNGSDPWQPGGTHHSGHGHSGNRSGRDIDFRYLNGNGVSFQSSTATTDAQFSQQNNQTVFDTAATFGFTTNYRGTNAPRMTNSTAARGHNDHGHLGFNRADATIIRHTVQVNPNGSRTWTRVP